MFPPDELEGYTRLKEDFGFRKRVAAMESAGGRQDIRPPAGCARMSLIVIAPSSVSSRLLIFTGNSEPSSSRSAGGLRPSGARTQVRVHFIM
jgi:hypothetical protein